MKNLVGIILYFEGFRRIYVVVLYFVFIVYVCVGGSIFFRYQGNVSYYFYLVSLFKNRIIFENVLFIIREYLFIDRNLF